MLIRMAKIEPGQVAEVVEREQQYRLALIAGRSFLARRTDVASAADACKLADQARRSELPGVDGGPLAAMGILDAYVERTHGSGPYPLL